MKWLHLEAEAETAIALPRRPEAGNLYECMAEIPGATVRGAFAALAEASHGSIDRSLFESHAIRFGPLRPLPYGKAIGQEGSCVLPVPRSARGCKYEGSITEHGALDVLLAVAAKERQDKQPTCPCCHAPIEPLDTDWLLTKWQQEQTGPETPNGWGRDYNPRFQLSTHVGIGEEGMAEEARLFSLQHFPAGTQFRGWIAFADDGKLAKLLSASDSSWKTTLRVGRRHHSMGALTVTATVQDTPPYEIAVGSLEERWQRFQNYFANTQLNTVAAQLKTQLLNDFKEAYLLSLTCLTELILLDDFLRPCRAITAAQLAGRLGLPPSTVKRLGLFASTRVVGGWHRAHKLPKLPDVAIVPGSVFLFAINKQDVDKEGLIRRLKKLEETGVGWRRSEGFGQVLFCDPWHLVGEGNKVGLSGKQQPTEVKVADAGRDTKPLSRNDPMRQFLCDNTELFFKKPLTRTQLTGLREFVNRLDQIEQSRPDKVKDALNKHFEHLKKRFTLREKWGVKVNEGKGLAEAVWNTLQRDEADWQTIHRRALFFVSLALLAIDAQEKETGLKKEEWQQLVKEA